MALLTASLGITRRLSVKPTFTHNIVLRKVNAYSNRGAVGTADFWHYVTHSRGKLLCELSRHSTDAKISRTGIYPVGAYNNLAGLYMYTSYMKRSMYSAIMEKATKRVGRACDQCRLKKTKVSTLVLMRFSLMLTLVLCDGEHICERCRARNSPCEYSHRQNRNSR
jgi:hypothetical protein